MKITIHSDEHHFCIPVWNGLFCSKISRYAVKCCMKKQMNSEFVIDPDLMDCFLAEFSKMAKEYKGLEIVHVESSNGDLVSIVL